MDDKHSIELLVRVSFTTAKMGTGKDQCSLHTEKHNRSGSPAFLGVTWSLCA